MHSTFVRGRPAGMAAAAFLYAALPADAQVEVIYTKIPSSPTSSIPGTLDLAGMPAPTNWRAIEDFNVSWDGSVWVVKGRTQLGSDLETVLVKGSDTSGTMFAQEGQPFQGAASGELYDFFDPESPVSFDQTGRMGFSARARGGVTTDNEKLIIVSAGGVHTQVLQQSDPLIGCVDVPANPSGDETVGNSIGSVQVLNDGSIAWGNTPIGNCHSSRYPGHFRNNVMFRQSGVSTASGQTWDSISYDGAKTTPDGMHWLAEGSIEGATTATDGILAFDDVIVLQEGSLVPGTILPMGAVFQSVLAVNGSWAARGDDNTTPSPATLSPDWAVRDGVLLAQTGDSVEGGAELWGDTFYSIAIDAAGNWALAGRTNNADPNADDVVVVNGVVVAREGDPVDVDGNGLFDDDAFIGRGNNTLAAFDAFDMRLAGGYLWLILELRNGAGMDLNSSPSFGTPNAFVRITLETPSTPFCSGDGSATACPCGNTGAPGNGCANSIFAAGASLDSTGVASIANDTLTLIGSNMPDSSALYFQGSAQVNGGLGAVFGDGLRCVGGTVARLRIKTNSGGMSMYPGPGDPPISVQGMNLAGVLRHYQIWYRNAAAFCTPSTFNLSNGLSLTWGP